MKCGGGDNDDDGFDGIQREREREIQSGVECEREREREHQIDAKVFVGEGRHFE